MKCKHQNINCNIILMETPGVLQSPVLCLSMHRFFLDTLFVVRIERLSLNIINNNSVQALCLGFTSCDLDNILWLLLIMMSSRG